MVAGVQVSHDGVWITHAVEIPSATPARTSYLIAEGARHSAIDSVRHTDPRVGYLGDWHSHPQTVGPSPTDTVAMAEMADDRLAECLEPLLVLAFPSADEAIRVYQWRERNLIRVHVVASGNLDGGDHD